MIRYRYLYILEGLSHVYRIYGNSVLLKFVLKYKIYKSLIVFTECIFNIKNFNSLRTSVTYIGFSIFLNFCSMYGLNHTNVIKRPKRMASFSHFFLYYVKYELLLG